MTKEETIDMLQKIREAANISTLCRLCPCEPFLCNYGEDGPPCQWDDNEMKEFVDRLFKTLENNKEK